MTPAQLAAAAVVMHRCAVILDGSPDDSDALLAAKAKAWLVGSGVQSSDWDVITVAQARDIVKAAQV